MRLVQLSPNTITFPSPEGAFCEPNMLLALVGEPWPRSPTDVC